MLASALLLALRIASESPEVQFRQPQLAASGETVAVTFGAGDTVYFAGSRDSGRSFSKPIVVARWGKLSLGMHRGPRIAITPTAMVISAIVGEKGRGADGDILAWRSTDGGKTWSDAARVNDVAGSAREGLHAMAAHGDLLFATWLDLRGKGTRLYGSASRDGGKTWSPNRVVYESPSGSVCECCHPSVTIDGRGTITVMFRNSADGARDMYIAQSRDGGQTFTGAAKLGDGTWILNACPMDGGDVAVDERGKVVTAWRREKKVYLSVAGEPERELGAGKDAAITVSRRGVFVAWTSPAGLQLLAPGKPEPVVLATDGTYARLLTLPSGDVLAAWETKAGITVEILNQSGK